MARCNELKNTAAEKAAAAAAEASTQLVHMYNVQNEVHSGVRLKSVNTRVFREEPVRLDDVQVAKLSTILSRMCVVDAPADKVDAESTLS